MLEAMPHQEKRSFAADSPVGRYWLLNCVGFRVWGSNGRSGIVEEVARSANGADVLAVRLPSVFNGRRVMVSADRVAAVHPWDETLVLARQTPKPPAPAWEPRVRPAVRVQHAALGRRLQPLGRDAAAAARTGLSAGRHTLRLGGLLVLGGFAWLASFARHHAPRVHRAGTTVARATAVIATAYLSELRRVVREETAALKAWNEQPRVRPSHVRGGQRRPRP
jgi:hypothetical protein